MFLGNAIYDSPGWWWLNYIEDQSKEDLEANSLFWCPSRKMKENMFKHNVLVANYGVNQSICRVSITNEKQSEFTGSPLSSADIQFPSQTLLIVDSGYATINWYHVTNSPPVSLGKSMEDHSYLPGLEMNKNRNLLPELDDDAINGRHLGKKVNIGYVDGHVDCLKAEDLFIEKTPGGYKNLSPLWVPQRK